MCVAPAGCPRAQGRCTCLAAHCPAWHRVCPSWRAPPLQHLGHPPEEKLCYDSDAHDSSHTWSVGMIGLTCVSLCTCMNALACLCILLCMYDLCLLAHPLLSLDWQTLLVLLSSASHHDRTQSWRQSAEGGRIQGYRSTLPELFERFREVPLAPAVTIYI